MISLRFLDDGNFLARWPEIILKGLKRVGIETSNDQIYNDQYLKNFKNPMLKVTRGLIIRFFYLRNYFLIFLKIIWTLNFFPPRFNASIFYNF